MQNKIFNDGKQKNFPCGSCNCIFADCASFAEGSDGVLFSVAPCEGFEGCPKRLGLTN